MDNPVHKPVNTVNAPVHDSFDGPDIGAPWRPWMAGTGALEHADGALYCVVNPTDDTRYSDAQITDYQGLPRSSFPWRPPLRLTVCAWTSHPQNELRGTAGFGFWNEPFVPIGQRWPRLPRAVWFFFGSPPNDMRLARGVAGYGWKAATIDAARWSFVSLVPVAPLGFLAMRSPWLYDRLWPVAQRVIGVSERALAVELNQPHTYELDWLVDEVIFRIDGAVVHTAPTSPRGPLGFIAWIDNQYAVVTPQGRFAFGVVTVPVRQWLALDGVTIHAL